MILPGSLVEPVQNHRIKSIYSTNATSRQATTAALSASCLPAQGQDLDARMSGLRGDPSSVQVQGPRSTARNSSLFVCTSVIQLEDLPDPVRLTQRHPAS